MIWFLINTSVEGTNLLQILVHEIGHSLGLSHSDTIGSLMTPFYMSYKPNLELHPDDVRAIEELYEVKRKELLDLNITSENSYIDESICNNSRIDAIVMTSSNETFAFRANIYWKLTENGVAIGYPKLISEHWESLENDIDAAFTSEVNGMTYIFKEDRYWVFKNTKYLRGPRKISAGFPGIPDDIDAAFIWSGNGDIYFFKVNLLELVILNFNSNFREICIGSSIWKRYPKFTEDIQSLYKIGDFLRQ